MRLWQVDAFTAEPFAGNPAAVCLLDGPRDDRWMQQVAAEMNLSETAFLLPEGEAYRLRWFTPTTEVDLCGHATLASAHVLFGKEGGPGGITFRTRSGELRASRRGDAIEIDFPSLPPTGDPPPPGLLEALGVPKPRSTHRSRFDRLVELDSEEAVRAVAPDFRALREVDTRGVIVTARGKRHDFVSRFFAPAAGVDEDPVTGSAHCVLAPFWAARLDRKEMTGFQASRRGGEVRVRLAGDRVFLGGRAVTVLEGELRA
ncbi:MAG TPA: PhzF family phenazine biosynthesis protein [Planctomycetota bacterium]|nr:PhzF family phenazine biosynthesis protein [Planctomycetota bacterium]